MTDESMPTLADDEATLALYANQLGDAIEAVAEPWMLGLVAGRNPGLRDDADVTAKIQDAAAAVVADLRALLGQDIAEQAVGPLELLRRAIAVPTELLVAAGTPPQGRDDFSRSAFPEDDYDLTPASFGDIDESLHEPGLTWGAAKAHVHLRRRRELADTPATPEPSVVALSVDLMDRSKISAAFPGAKLVRSIDKVMQASSAADLVLVDLGRLADSAELHALTELATGRVIAFGSHVNEAELAAAAATGAEALPRSVFFRRLESGDL